VDKQQLQAALAKYTSSIRNYRHPSRLLYYTDGIAFFAAHAGAQWLIDFIAAHQKRLRRDRALRELQIWTIRVTAPLRIQVSCRRASNDNVFRADLQLFSPFALDEVTLYVEDETLMLPGERH
jgi:hypothetical protein